MLRENHKRSILRSIIWRIMGVIILALVTWIFTRNLVQVGLITFIHHAMFLVIYYLHERLWQKIKWKGKRLKIARTITYEIILGHCVLGLISFLVTGSWTKVAWITITYIGNKLWIYVLYDYIWDRIKWGTRNFKIGNFCTIGKNVTIGDNVEIWDYISIGDNCKIGDRTIIKSYTYLAPDTTIGKDCTIGRFVKSSGQNKIGDNVTIRYDAIIAREVTIEDNVFISPQVMTIYKTYEGKKIGGIHIGKNAFIGTNVTLSNGVKIGEGVVIGAKSLVTKDCLEKGIYIGIPAKLLKKLG